MIESGPAFLILWKDLGRDFMIRKKMMMVLGVHHLRTTIGMYFYTCTCEVFLFVCCC